MDYQLSRLKAQIAVLKDVATEYPNASISNAIVQIQSRINEIESQTKE